MTINLSSVAIAEDDSAVVRILETVMSKAGYTLAGRAVTGEEAVTLVQLKKPQLLVLDLGLPILNGLEALKKIVPLQTTAVVVLTAESSSVAAREAMDLGACGFFQKPMDLASIVPMLETSWHRFQKDFALSKANRDLTDALELRKIVEKAKGILMEQQNFSEEQAHKVLQKMSQDQGIALKEVCRSVIQVKMLLGKAASRKSAA
jgi:two-component system, response regulator PdtaR